MKKRVSMILVCVVMFVCLASCGTADFKSDVIGTWTIFHWYEHAENGVDVFLDDTNYYTVVIDENSFKLTSKDDSLKDVGGTYQWTKTDEAEVIMNDSTRCTIQISENDKKHNKSSMWDIYVIETNMTYCLEIPEGTK